MRRLKQDKPSLSSLSQYFPYLVHNIIEYLSPDDFKFLKGSIKFHRSIYEPDKLPGDEIPVFGGPHPFIPYIYSPDIVLPDAIASQASRKLWCQCTSQCTPDKCLCCSHSSSQSFSRVSCGDHCSCGQSCPNRLFQTPISPLNDGISSIPSSHRNHPFCLVWFGAKGWGVVTTRVLPPDTFIGWYAGDVWWWW